MKLVNRLPLALAETEEVIRCLDVHTSFHYVGFDLNGDALIYTDDLEQAAEDPRISVIRARLTDWTLIFFKVKR